MNAIIIGATILYSLNACCCAAQESVVGQYQSHEIDLVDKGFYFLKGVRHFAAGVTLVVNADSTFSYTTCMRSGIQKGKWAVNNRSLVLTANAQIGEDSRSRKEQGKKTYTIEYAIKDRSLSRIAPFNVGPVAFLLSKK